MHTKLEEHCCLKSDYMMKISLHWNYKDKTSKPDSESTLCGIWIVYIWTEVPIYFFLFLFVGLVFAFYSYCHFKVNVLFIVFFLHQIFLVVANSKEAEPELSVIYRWNQRRRRFLRHQTLETHSALDWEAFHIHNHSFLVVANHRRGKQTLTDVARVTARKH